jgi:hypothetical protein
MKLIFGPRFLLSRTKTGHSNPHNGAVETCTCRSCRAFANKFRCHGVCAIRHRLGLKSLQTLQKRRENLPVPCQTTSQDPTPALHHFRFLARRRERGLTSLKTINNQVRRKQSQIKRSKASSQDRISPRILRRCFRVYTRIRVRSLHVTLNLHLTLDRSLSHLQLNFMMGIRQNDRRSSFLTGILFDDVNSIDRVVYTDSCSRSDEP